MKRARFLIVMCIASAALLAGCAQSGDPAAAVTAYFQALVAKKVDDLPKLVCSDWEKEARTEFDSFGAVQATLNGLDCKQSGTSGDFTLVSCQGKISVTYQGQSRDLLDLQSRTYQVKMQDGEWRMCGYQ